MAGDLRAEMTGYLTMTEVDTLARRIDYLEMYPVYPMPPTRAVAHSVAAAVAR